jgi:soluble lytic murein transglycosylase-like protein
MSPDAARQVHEPEHEEDRMTNPTPQPRRPGRERSTLARGGALLVGAVVLSALGGWTRRARSTDVPSPDAAAPVAADVRADADRRFDGRSALLKLRLDRAEAILAYSSRYQIPADLAGSIYDIALSEGIDPELGFRLVKVESNFKPTARSPKQAIGYAQVQLATARFYLPNVTEEQLYERDVNLRVGFRFLKSLLKQYKYDYHLALLAYNRGPGRVDAILSEGGDPANGYSAAILGGNYAPRKVTAKIQREHAEVVGSAQ